MRSSRCLAAKPYATSSPPPEWSLQPANRRKILPHSCALRPTSVRRLFKRSGSSSTKSESCALESASGPERHLARRCDLVAIGAKRTWCDHPNRLLMTHNGHRDGFQLAPQQTHGRHSIIGGRRMLAPPSPCVFHSRKRTLNDISILSSSAAQCQE